MSKVTIFKNLLSNPNYPGIHDVNPQEVQDLKSQLTIIDVRRNDEYTGELGHIPGAEWILLDTVPENMNRIPKDKPVVIVCRSGGRSANATAFLHSKGYENVVNMRGGMLAWNELKFPIEK